MDLSRNRKLRKRWIGRKFVSDPRHLVFVRNKITSLLISVSERTGVQPQRLLKKRCKKIARFALLEERTSKRKKNIDNIYAIVTTVIQLLVIPIGVFVFYNDRIASGWGYSGGYILVVFIMPLLLVLPVFLIAGLIGFKLKPFSNAFSHFMANVAVVIICMKLYYHFELPYWILAGLLTFVFFNIQVWILNPFMLLIIRHIGKLTSKSYPKEKGIHLAAALANAMFNAQKKGRLGNSIKRNVICQNIEALAVIFEEHFYSSYFLDNSNSKILVQNQCRLIANYFRAQKMKIYFSDSDTAKKLSEYFDLSFVALMEGNLGKLSFCENAVPVKKGILNFILKLLPSACLFIIWACISFTLKSEISESLHTTLWFVFASLLLTTIVQFFDPDLDKKFSLISNIKSITRK